MGNAGKEPLTPRQREILDWVKAFIANRACHQRCERSAGLSGSRARASLSSFRPWRGRVISGAGSSARVR